MPNAVTGSPRLNWEDARYFLTIARAGTLGSAAQQLGISTLTLSRHLSHLQSRTGTQLLVRQSKGFKLTDEGQRLVEYLERAEAEFEAAAELFGSDAQRASGTVRIAAPEGFALKLLAPNLGVLLDAHPELNLEIVPQSRGFSLSRREADIAVMVGKPTEPNLSARRLGAYGLGLFASTAYLDQFGTPDSIDELSQHRLVGYVEDLLFSERLNTPRSVWNPWRSQIAIYSPVGQVEAVQAGLGIGVLHRFLIDEAQLVPVLPEIEIEREFYLVCHPSTERIPRIRVVLDFLKTLSPNLSQVDA